MVVSTQKSEATLSAARNQPEGRMWGDGKETWKNLLVSHPPCNFSTSTCSWVWQRCSRTARLRPAGRRRGRPAPTASDLSPGLCPHSHAWCRPPEGWKHPSASLIRFPFARSELQSSPRPPVPVSAGVVCCSSGLGPELEDPPHLPGPRELLESLLHLESTCRENVSFVTRIQSKMTHLSQQ